MRKISTLALIASARAVSACNTISGSGRDVEAVGDAVTNSAEDARN